MAILVTGGAGYIGSHTCVQLLAEGHEIVVADNLANSKETAVNYIKGISGRDFNFYQYDLKNMENVEEIFNKEKIDSVIHFAGYNAVGESVENPIMYYENNIITTINIIKAMKKRNIKKFIFSSSATVYGDPQTLPISEDANLTAANPYGYTKLMIEQMLKDLHVSDSEWNITLLRYFNPIGGHPTGLLPDNPKGIPNNLMPYIIQVYEGKLKEVNVFGDDYPTIDGTGVRDYIHVIDLADGHVAALDKMKESGVHIFNLGTGTGYSVLQLIKAFEKTNKCKISYVIAQRRAGDIAECFADARKAEAELGWKAKKTLEEMCRVVLI
jgi:UDP-glucose 4-epimerase